MYNRMIKTWLILNTPTPPPTDPQRDPNWCHTCGRMGPCPGERH